MIIKKNVNNRKNNINNKLYLNNITLCYEQ